jgi:XTP/dITP diphosphohydrolase/tetrapyrrole methylase family protein/MazG family protein/ATP diphosphatase
LSEFDAGAFIGLLEIMRRLRAPGGCPWDAEQTLASLTRYILEESYELAEAIREGSPEDIREECGDLLLQVVFAAQIASESGMFDIRDVCLAISEKLVRRHPHVFGDVTVDGAEEVTRNWERIKAGERKRRDADSSAMAGIPRGLPALLRAVRMSERASKIGFDWKPGDIESVRDKVLEELGEFRAEIESANPDGMREELGDLLFALANLARRLGIDPESALQGANAKFSNRIRSVEALAAGSGDAIERMSLEELDELWRRAKLAERHKV